jgi:hypothetical protein
VVVVVQDTVTGEVTAALVVAVVALLEEAAVVLEVLD